jgi:hypothetical protein
MELQLLNIIVGIQEVLVPQNKTITFRGTAADGPTLNGPASSFIAPYKATHEQKAVLAGTIQLRREQRPAAKKFIKDFRAGVVATFGEDSPEFLKFGFKPRKQSAPLSADQKQLKVARLRATRMARGTRGRRQRAEVKGNVPAPTPDAPRGDAPSTK